MRARAPIIRADLIDEDRHDGRADQSIMLAGLWNSESG
jgi:hypothetical protein